MRNWLLFAVAVLCSACVDSGTYVHLDLQGDAPEEMVALELELELAGQRALTRISQVVSLPSSAVLSVAQGEGELAIRARLVDAQGRAGAQGTGSALVERGSTSMATLFFTRVTEGGGSPGTGAPPQNPGPVIGPGELSFDPSTFDFGAALVGGSGSSRSFRLINSGAFPSAPVAISVAGASAASFVLEENHCVGVALLGGSECNVTVRFAPAAAGLFSAALVASSADSDVSVALTGNALSSGALTIDQTAHDFGSLALGVLDATHTFTITNTGDTPTGTLALALSGSDASFFVVESTTCTGALAPTATCTVTIRFLASVTGMRNASLIVSANPGDAAIAQLSAAATVRLTVVNQAIAGASGVVVSGQPGLIDCGATCAADVSASTVTLRAQPAAGFYFGGWSGDCTGFDDCVLDMSQSRSVTARFSAANKMFTTATLLTIAQVKALGGSGSTGQKMQQGADAYCSQRAQAVGISGTFRAFLSSSAGNALSRLSATGARGWLRVDGKPFADSLAATFNQSSPELFYAPDVDENGVVSFQGGQDQRIWTGTLPDGTTGATCLDWSSTQVAQTATIGDVSSGAGLFAKNDVFGFNCSQTTQAARLLCMQVDYTVRVTVPAAPSPRREIFVTAARYLPTQGLPGADALCMSEAAAALRTGTYKAMLATATSPIKNRFVADERPVVRPDGVVISPSATLMFNNPARAAAISLDLFGRYYPTLNQEHFVWSGAQTLNGLDGRTCGDWTDGTGNGQGLVGRANAVSVGFGYTVSGCDMPRPVYCLEE